MQVSIPRSRHSMHCGDGQFDILDPQHTLYEAAEAAFIQEMSLYRTVRNWGCGNRLEKLVFPATPKKFWHMQLKKN